jgi:hypothetical protein
MAVAGGVALSTIVSFYFTPAAFRLVYARREKESRSGEDSTVVPLLLTPNLSTAAE